MNIWLLKSEKNRTYFVKLVDKKIYEVPANDHFQSISIKRLVSGEAAKKHILEQTGADIKKPVNGDLKKAISDLQTIITKKFCWTKNCDYLSANEIFSNDCFPIDRIARLCREGNIEFLDDFVIPPFCKEIEVMLDATLGSITLSLEDYAKCFANLMFTRLEKIEVVNQLFSKKFVCTSNFH
ncbi:hypothetical protein [endosymbiont GvMRE of Glomus versiforme]|uniref:hypothetical protein n=1 Tax=endosymbiont GvMRE of Glomus versiforme TaxID=2039283 RepID=UPI0011C49BED|nr:hypothetical protein [endosymbiont GvMRE of Glomus versiforme]